MHTFAAVLIALSAAPNADIPLFARRYGVTCNYCHVTPPKLNGTGEAFIARGYRLPERDARGTWPLAVWISGRSEALPGVDALRSYLNRIEIISGGVVAPGLSYFVEWRPLSLETRTDGSLRDRSGRFEDLFVVATLGAADATLGQFRLMGQVDVSRRVGIAEPLVLSTSLAGEPGATPRETALRAFSPSGRSPAARLGVTFPIGAGAWRWTTSAALPLPGELSVPLTDDARVEASSEIEADPKGVLVESFARRGLHSVGAHLFYDRSNRYLAHAIATGERGPLYWTAIAGFARSRASPATLGRWSLEAEYLPRGRLGAGTRIEELAADGRQAAVILYLNAHAPGTRFTVRLTVEQRIQRDRNATLIELGTVF